jgi:hypothetical protein
LTDLGFSAAVVEQPSPDTAGIVVVRLENPTATGTVIRDGQSLLFSGKSSPPGLQDDRGINLVHENTLDLIERIDGCLRYPGPSVTPTVIVSRSPRILPPRTSVEDRYGVVTSPDADECLPTGEHRVENEIAQDGFEATIALTITVGDDGRLSVATSGPSRRRKSVFVSSR